jgi:hypothetical protein
MRIERNATSYKVLTVGELDCGNIFELTIGPNVGTPIIKVETQSIIDEDAIVGFNLISNERMILPKTYKCYLAINVLVKYDLQKADVVQEEIEEI